jgi:glycosyltransferase involved in cell wall biosynthesis
MERGSDTSNQMHILWISGSKIVGGAERATIQILRELRRRGHLISALYRYSPEFDNAVRAEKFRSYVGNLGGSLNVFATFTIGRALARLHPDVAIVTTADEWVWASIARRSVSGTRLILVRHMALALPARVRRLANWRADAIIAVSEASRDNLLIRPGIAPERVHVIGNPVRFDVREEPPLPSERADARKALGISTQGPWIGFFGGTEPKKGIRDVFQVMRDIVATDGACNLLVCGRRAKNPKAPSVETLVTEHGLGSCTVHDLGQIEEVAKALTACDAVVIATHADLSEGQPLTALEAMACGTPVVAYATGGLKEVLGSNQEAGLLAIPDDPSDLFRQLRQILSDSDFPTRLARTALQRLRDQFSLQQIVDDYESLLTHQSEQRR